MIIANSDFSEAFCAACRSCQLAPDFVLQNFADAVSVHGFLDPNAVPATSLASKIVLCFSRTYKPVVPIDALKRKRAIRSIRNILRVLQSLASNEQKEISNQRIIGNWYQANRLKGEGTELYLHNTLSIILPKGLLLECDILRCRPQDLLDYFMGQLVKEIQEDNPNGAAIPFLLYCISLIYPIENN